MRQYGNKTIADVGKYLDASNNMTNYALRNMEGVTFEEKELTDEFKIMPDGSVCYGGIFNTKKYEDLKKRLISQIWSNDDQIAIILNQTRSDADKEMFDFMQEWREYFGELAKKILEISNS